VFKLVASSICKNGRRLVMKTKWMTFLAGVAILTIALLTDYRPVTAAPAGELKLVNEQMGHEIPIPHLEMGQGIDYMKLLYDPLVGTSPDAQLSTGHGLAYKWEMSRDGLTWTFYLRKGIKFHDGVEVTAKDVKFSLEMVTSPASQVTYVKALRDTIKSVETRDPYTVVIHCKKPSLFLISLFDDGGSCAGLIQPKDYYERVGKDEFAKHPIGSGPYKLHSQQVGSFIRLEATDRHWRDGVPRYKYVTFLKVPEEYTRISMLKAGEADITLISQGKVKEVADAGLNVVFKENAAMVSFMCNMQWASPVFSDIRFRKALNLAIDREAIIKHILGGRGKLDINYPGVNILVCGGDRTLKPYPYAPEEARRLIREGGYEGYEFRIPSYTRLASPEFPVVTEAISGYWEKIGLKPRIFASEWITWRERWLAQKVENHICGNAFDVDPECASLLNRLFQFYHSKSFQTICRIPEVDAMIEKAQKSLDRSEVLRLVGDIHRYVNQNYIDIPVCSMDQGLASTQRIPRWDPGQRRMGNNINDVVKQPS
jgi:peptide/nickel transport system substrate-binding protein